jgi:hypothetical protein
MTKKTKKNWLKRQFNKVQLLPWYWKSIATIVIFFLGGTFGTQLFTAASDLSMFFRLRYLDCSVVVFNPNVDTEKIKKLKLLNY